VSLILGFALIDTAKTLFGAAQHVDAAGLFGAIFGATAKSSDTIQGAIKAYKALKGEKPKSVVIDQSTHTTIFNMGDGNSYHVEGKTAQLYADDRVIKAIDNVLNPLAAPGLDSLEVKKEKVLIDKLQKVDLPGRLLASEEATYSATTTSDGLNSTREILLQVTKVSFESGKWTFSDGQSKFGASIEDEGFKAKVLQRQEGFFAGDTLHVILRTSQKLGRDNRLETKHVIERVIQHHHAPMPAALPFSSEESPGSNLGEGEKR
jgi:hypothetical protein